MLRRLGRTDEADKYLEEARETRDEYLKKYPRWLEPDQDDELVVFDQMVSMWAGRFTGPMKQKLEVAVGAATEESVTSPTMGVQALSSDEATLQGDLDESGLVDNVAPLTLQTRQTL